MNQREVWENIARDWASYRRMPPAEAAEFMANKSGAILDLGCGSGRNFVRTDATIIGTDFSINMLRLARKNAKEKGVNAHLAVSDVAALPFRSGSFDAVLASNLLPSVKYNKHRKVLGEIVRVSRNGAPVFISVWNRDQPHFARMKREAYVPWKAKRKEYQRYYYLYSKDELETLLKKYFRDVRVFGSAEKAFSRYPKNLIATGKVRK